MLKKLLPKRDSNACAPAPLTDSLANYANTTCGYREILIILNPKQNNLAYFTQQSSKHVNDFDL